MLLSKFPGVLRISNKDQTVNDQEIKKGDRVFLGIGPSNVDMLHTQTVNDEIDEVESLTAPRAGGRNGTFGWSTSVLPSSTVIFFVQTIIQGLNALLTQLDKLKQRENVLIMASNLVSES